VVAGLALLAATALAQQAGTPYRSNEVTLAGLRPGRDNLAAALKRYKPKYVTDAAGAPDKKQWRDTCTGRLLELGVDGRLDIQTITVSALVTQDGKCDDRRFDTLDEKSWTTGHGLRLSDPQNRVIELYGEAQSSGPSTKGGRDVEFLRYAFDWAGSDVPRAMEIDCDRDTGRVLEIVLAYSSL
jgi:hypothetical protein